MNLDDIEALISKHGSITAQPLMDLVVTVVLEAVEAEREACAKIVEPSEEHRRDASWGYLGGEEGVEMLDSLAAAIRARSNV